MVIQEGVVETSKVDFAKVEEREKEKTKALEIHLTDTSLTESQDNMGEGTCREDFHAPYSYLMFASNLITFLIPNRVAKMNVRLKMSPLRPKREP